MLGEKVFPSRLAALMSGESWALRSQPKPAVGDVPLSGRELEIVQRLTDGLPNKLIASELSITEATVKVHLKTILKKIGAQNRTQAAIWAVQRGFSTAPDVLSHHAGPRALKLEPAA
jgi:two-component system nitrate/nitrite response regulator NarL